MTLFLLRVNYLIINLFPYMRYTLENMSRQYDNIRLVSDDMLGETIILLFFNNSNLNCYCLI